MIVIQHAQDVRRGSTGFIPQGFVSKWSMPGMPHVFVPSENLWDSNYHDIFFWLDLIKEIMILYIQYIIYIHSKAKGMWYAILDKYTLSVTTSGSRS